MMIIMIMIIINIGIIAKWWSSRSRARALSLSPSLPLSPCLSLSLYTHTRHSFEEDKCQRKRARWGGVRTLKFATYARKLASRCLIPAKILHDYEEFLILHEGSEYGERDLEHFTERGIVEVFIFEFPGPFLFWFERHTLQQKNSLCFIRHTDECAKKMNVQPRSLLSSDYSPCKANPLGARTPLQQYRL